MDADVIKELGEKEVSPRMSKILSDSLALLKSGRSRMSNRYAKWDEQHRVYMARRQEDKDDGKRGDEGVPPKMVVPLSFGQINTFVSYCFLLFGQNDRFFELDPVSMRDHDLREVSETLLEHDLKANKWSLVCYQALLDTAKFGLGVIKTSWRREYESMVMPDGQAQDVLSYVGNRYYNISPYRFFPDHRHPIRDFQKGEYCASHEEYSKMELKSLEANGFVAGVDEIPSLEGRSDDYGLRKVRFCSIDPRRATANDVVVTEIQRKIIPSQYKDDTGKPLGPETRPVTFVIWIANDSRIIRFERLNAAHCRFTYSAHELHPDIHEQLNIGLGEITDTLQEVIGWFLNSRVEAVTRTVDNLLVVDPQGVNIDSLERRDRVIMLNKGVSGQGVDRFLKQLVVQDTTTGHVGDAQSLMQLLQTVTGVNENAMGQYNSGRRSATEARAVIQGSSGRMRLLAQLIWDGLLSGVAYQSLLNSRQSLPQEVFAKVVGEEKVGLYALYALPIQQLVGSADFFIFNGTLPSEKSFLAQTLQELLAIVLQSPEAALSFNLNPNKLIQEIYELRGIPGLARFAFTPEELAAINSQRAAAGIGGAEGPTDNAGVPGGGGGAPAGG